MFLQCKFNTFFTLPQRYDTSCPFSATKIAPNVAGAGENGGSATKTAHNVDENEARLLLGMRTRRPGHGKPYHL